MITLPRIYRWVVGLKDSYLYQIGHYFRKKLILPEQTARDRLIFKKVFQLYSGKSLRIFEYGAGFSTIFYGRYLDSIGADFEWHAIDNSREWQEKVGHLVEQYHLSDRVHLHLSEFPAFWQLPDWSWKEMKIPEDVCRPGVTEYVEYPQKIAGERGFDVIIVDGRFRRRCLLVAAEVLASSGVVLLHDAQKTHYHGSLDTYPFSYFSDGAKLPGARDNIRTWLGTFDHNRLLDIMG